MTHPRPDQIVGLIGLGVMGSNLAINLGGKQIKVLGFDLDPERREEARSLWSGSECRVVDSLKGLLEALPSPRRVFLMVPAGDAVDRVIEETIPMLVADDIVLDCGNSFFKQTEQRALQIDSDGFRFLGVGISGGSEGVRLGPSVMPGGSRSAYNEMESMLTSMAAQTDEGPCCAYLGSGGAGHFVKMVHNGIEYGVMQLVSETYDLFSNLQGLRPPEIGEIFARWNRGDLESFLTEITARVLATKDDQTGAPLVDCILDTAGQKGTGRWTSESALELGVAIPTIDAAVSARVLSAQKQERAQAARVLPGPKDSPPATSIPDLTDTLESSLRLATLITYSQGFALLQRASMAYEWDLDLASVARLWMGGCIIRARVLGTVEAAFAAEPRLYNLLLSPELTSVANELAPALRRTVGLAARSGFGGLGFGSALGYFDTIRRARLPANLIQAQRDRFGGHGYQRIDRSGNR